ncbi:MAG: phosphatidylserine/phosphatidylglycerophosphate/cardiolipin synthase family protein [Bacteroidota bacterium]
MIDKFRPVSPTAFSEARYFPTPALPRQLDDKIYFMTDEREVLQARWDMVRREREEIIVSYCLFDGNRLGRIALAELRAAARRGVRVRIILNELAPGAWRDEKITPATIQALQEDGLEIRSFHPVTLRQPRTLFSSDGFTRLHDKLLYLRGQKLLFTGDRNMQNFNFRSQRTKGRKGRSYRSVEIMAQGKMVRDAQQHLERIWEKSADYPLPRLTPKAVERARGQLKLVWKLVQASCPDAPRDWTPKMVAVDKIEFLGDDPLRKGREFPIDDRVLALIAQARRRIVIMSPYLSLTDAYEQRLRTAMHQRGVEVCVVTASEATNDNRFAFNLFRHHAWRLSRLGARIFYHDGPDFLHAKLVEIDGHTAFIGAHNFNNRSKWIDIESGVIVTDRKWVRAHVQPFIDRIVERESRQLDHSRTKTWREKRLHALGWLLTRIPGARKHY